jgi:uracil-DNA glycosylase family 4
MPCLTALYVPSLLSAIMDRLSELMAEVVACRACPRLVEWRERVAREKRSSFRQDVYWGRPLPSFGDPEARIVILGLAPAAHGGNRTGRIFTGDRSGDWLFASLHRTGFANQATSTRVDDGLQLFDAYIAAAVRCAPPANKPTIDERDRCIGYFVRELPMLRRARVIVCLGSFAWDAALKAVTAATGERIRPKPRFGHLAETAAEPYWLLGSYHPSQQNTFTGKLTEAMLDSVFRRARDLSRST